MRESTSGSSDTYMFHALFSPKELDVGDILVDLKDLIAEFESPKRFSFTWGVKRKRSAINSNPISLRFRASQPFLQRASREEERESDGMLKVKSKATSPMTPLSFCPSESDEKYKSKRSLKKNSLKRTRKEWLENIDELTQRKQQLTKEVDVVREYYKKLLTFNLALKAKKDELNYCLINKNTELETNRDLDLGKKVNRRQYPVQPHPSFVYQTAHISGLNGQIAPLVSSSSSGFIRVNEDACLHRLPDLNVCAEED